MIIVFVVDTSPSMAEPADQTNKDGTSRISRLDVAKMAVENICRSRDKSIVNHNATILNAAKLAAARQQQFVGRLEQFDEFMLLSTSLQSGGSPNNTEGRKRNSSLDETDTSGKRSRSSSFHSTDSSVEMHSTCGAGGRLLVGCVDGTDSVPFGGAQPTGMVPHPPNRADFEREVKRLRCAPLPTMSSNSSSKHVFPDSAGGAIGLSTALSHGLGLLSRYRLTHGSIVENFGMGRLPWFEHQMVGFKDKNEHNATKNVSPLQPACLVLVTDGECLHLPQEKGGGVLRLQFGNAPLREFYKEPFRWDQRIFILHIASSSAPPLHNSLQLLCEVTGGAVLKVQQSAASFSKLLSILSPPQPKPHSIPDPLRLPQMPEPIQVSTDTQPQKIFTNGGPIVGFQAFEREVGAPVPSLHRSMLLFSGMCEQTRWIFNATKNNSSDAQPNIQSPLWFVPESFYPSKKLDTLPPRPSQPLLHYSRNYQAVGSSFFDPIYVIKALHHLDRLQVKIRQQLVDFGENPPSIANRMLQRDVYICEWLGGTKNSLDSNQSGAPRTMQGREHFPVGVVGAGRPTISGEAGEDVLNIGILHVPVDWKMLKDLDSNAQIRNQSTIKLATLTFLPPDAHILLPLLIKAAESELRALNKIREKGGSRAGAVLKTVHMDDSWKSDFRAYLFRLPQYYLPAMRRALHTMLPISILQFLNTDGQEPMPLLCMSRVCVNKISAGEKYAKDGNDWLRSIERNLTHQKLPVVSAVVHDTLSNASSHQTSSSGYGNFDPCMTVSSYKSMLRGMTPPWNSTTQSLEKDETTRKSSVNDILGALPQSCLLPYYETRRRWIFGGTGLTTRGIHVNGTNNDGVNSHHCSSADDKPLIVLAGVGAESVNETNINIMGDFRERLHYSQVPLTGYGGSNAVGSPVTTAVDGSPVTSVDDDVFPSYFFNKETAEFVDTPQTRSLARMTIHFANPFAEKRGPKVPDKFNSQRPTTPSSTPPREDEFESTEAEGEGEAAFAGKASRNPRHHHGKLDLPKQAESVCQGGNSTNDPMQLDSENLKSVESSKGPDNSTNQPMPLPPRAASTEVNPNQKLPSAHSARKPPPPAQPGPTRQRNTENPAHAIAAAVAPADLQNANQKPNIKLPPGWMSVWSRSQKRWYFFNTTNNKSVWEWPPPGGK